LAPPIKDPRRPHVTPDTVFFWEGAREHRFLIQRCTACGTLRHPPRPMCAHCSDLGWDTVEAAGDGTLHSYGIVHHPRVEGFPEPFVVALVDMPEGIRFLTNLVETELDGLRIGMPVRLRFTEVGDGVTLPLFTAAS
jgi:uncharacterized OB-fold protein